MKDILMGLLRHQPSEPTFSLHKMNCIWMNAGILPHMVCEKNFECTRCPLDTALRQQFDESFNLPQMVENEEDVLSKYFFTRNHCWIQQGVDGVVRIGLEPMLVNFLPMLKTVVLPSEGDNVFHTQSAFWIITEGGTFSLPSPLDGRVLSHNKFVTDHPAELLLHPLTRGWLYELKTTSSATVHKYFMDKTTAYQVYKNDFVTLREFIRNDIKNFYQHVGPTQADGGEVQNNVQAMLGPRRYFELYQHVFVRGMK